MDVAIYGLGDLEKMAAAVSKSGLFGMKRPEEALALMLVAQSENSHPATITQDYDIIQGRACRKTHSVLARFQQMGGVIEWHQLTESIADATFSHKNGGSLRMSWTIEQAKKAGLTNKDNWKNYPRAMLRARLVAEGVRSVYPAAIGGMLIAEEAVDLDSMKDITPPRRQSATEIATASTPETDFDNNERMALIADLETLASGNGIDVYANAWAALAKSQRTLIGANEHARLKSIAEEATRLIEAGGVIDGDLHD